MTGQHGQTWFVTGAGGMLGRDLVTALHAAGEHVLPFGRADLDVTDSEAIDAAIMRTASGWTNLIVVNLAAWTDVDLAEEYKEGAYAVNACGAANVARACARHGARLIHLSTDYVFAGTATTPYRENAAPTPVSAYGRTKAEGERAVLSAMPNAAAVLRTAWLYGEHGRNFVRTIRRLAEEHEFLDVVNDQTGQPTWTADVAERIIAIGRSPRANGVFHATSTGQTTWFGLARAVFAESGLDPVRIRPTTTDRFPRPAPRPAYSVLGHDRWAELGLPPIRPWRDALAAAAQAMLRSG